MSEYREGNEPEAQSLPLSEPFEEPEVPPTEAPRVEEQPVLEAVPTPEATQDQPTGKRVMTAFLVVLLEDGRVEAGVNLPGVQMQRAPQLHDIRNMCSALYDDIVIEMSARASGSVAGELLGQSVRQATERMQTEKLRQQIGAVHPGKGGFSPGAVPGRRPR